MTSPVCTVPCPVMDQLTDELRGIENDLELFAPDNYDLAVIRSNLRFVIEQAETAARPNIRRES